ncbi:MAG TPA: methyltransferase type 11 [Planctomycetaceae bacterium]|jgi:SAM-dependent methyltransferase|nr:methyltransferase type 11 [Planctomycetaceae bacterium]
MTAQEQTQHSNPQPAQWYAPGTTQPLTPNADASALCSPDGTVVAPIQNGIPRFVSDQHLDSFGFQWTHFDVAHEAEDQQTFLAKTGVTPQSLRNLHVLDAGCGGGRYALLCGTAGAHVTAADHSRAVDKAATLCQQLPNVRFLQADLKQLPLLPESFDFVFSIGVMHHDAQTQAVFQAVAKLVRPGGRLSVWLYRRNQWWQELINSTLRACTTRLPAGILLPLCHLGALLGGIPVINRTLNKIVCFSAHPCYQNRVCDTWDWWAPQYQHHHTTQELTHWFTTAGFTDIKELPPEKNGHWYRRLWQWNLLPGSGVNVTGIRRI